MLIQVEHEDRQRKVAYWQTSKGCWMSVEGEVIFISHVQHGVTKQSMSQEEDYRVLAPMTGRILEIRVQENEEVLPDTVVVVLEAMKMEYRLHAPRAGVIEKIHCSVGSLIELGTLLVSLKQ